MLVALAVYWFSTKREPLTLKNAQQEMAKGARKLGDAIENLDTEKLKDELARTGRIVRENATRLGEAVGDVSADARITNAIKAKLQADPDLSTRSISVTTKERVVTLSGSVPSHETLRKVLVLALGTDGVQKVDSTLQIAQ